MKSRTKNVVVFAILVLGLAPFSFGQLAAEVRNPNRVLGYYDPATGVFAPLQREVQVPEAPVAPTTGTITFKFTFTVKAAVPKNSVILCKGTAGINESSSGFATDENATGIAKLVSGTTYSCTATINYSWPLTSATTDTIFLQADASINYVLQATATNGASVLASLVTERSAHPNVAAISVPPNGATTTENISITL